VGDAKVQKMLGFNVAEMVEEILDFLGEEKITGF
jgi:hypothetical protein